jgi:biotin carboxylase
VQVTLLDTTKEQPVRLLTADSDVALTVITEPRYAELYRARARTVLVRDVEDLTAVRDAAMRAAAGGQIDYVVSATERTLQAGGYLRSLLGLPGIPFEVANAMSGKYAMKLAFRAAGLPVAPFRLVTCLRDVPSSCGDMSWPLVIKPVMGTGAMNTFAVATPAEFDQLCRSPSSAALRRMRIPLIVESQVRFEWEFHSEGIVRDGELAFVTAGRYFGSLLKNIGKVNGSLLLPADAPERPVIEDLHRRAVAAVRLRDGVTHLQGFRTTTGFVLSEITCRPAGGAIPDLIEAQYGVDLWDAFVQCSLGRAPEVHARDRGGTFARCWIPPVPGVVTSLATAAELEAVPWVTRALVTASAGDTVGPPADSCSHVAMVIYRAASPRAALARAAEVVALARFTTS